MNTYRTTQSSQFLIHHGIKGQRWGVRRFQNEDGTLTAAGKRRLDAKTGYENAKDEYRNNLKSLPQEAIKHPIKTGNGTSKYADAYSNMIVAKAKYKSSKYDDPNKREKVEKKVYARALAMAGRKLSEKNVNNYGVGGNLQDRLRKEKGEAYVKNITQRINSITISSAAAGTAVGLGIVAFGAYKAIKTAL